MVLLIFIIIILLLVKCVGSVEIVWLYIKFERIGYFLLLVWYIMVFDRVCDFILVSGVDGVDEYVVIVDIVVFMYVVLLM